MLFFRGLVFEKTCSWKGVHFQWFHAVYRCLVCLCCDMRGEVEVCSGSMMFTNGATCLAIPQETKTSLGWLSLRVPYTRHISFFPNLITPQKTSKNTPPRPKYHIAPPPPKNKKNKQQIHKQNKKTTNNKKKKQKTSKKNKKQKTSKKNKKQKTTSFLRSPKTTPNRPSDPRGPRAARRRSRGARRLHGGANNRSCPGPRWLAFLGKIPRD